MQNILSEILTKQIQQHVKRITHHDQMEYNPEMQGRFKTQKSLSVLLYINGIHYKSYMIISRDVGKAFEKSDTFS